jgi:tetratricopeptide (TPR) repeat protein
MRKSDLALIAMLTFLGRAAHAGSEAHERYLHGLLSERKGDLATALSDYQKAVELDPQALEVYRDLAQLNLRTGRTDAALRAAQRVRDLAPTESSSFLFLGHVHVARGDLPMAAQEYEKALQLDPKNLKALENLANYYSSINPPKAVEYYRRYLQTDPYDPEIYFQMGFLHQKQNDGPQAIAAFKKSIQLDPQQVASHLALAELYELQRSTASAVTQYQWCTRLDPRNPAFYARLGHLYYANRQWDEAASQFQSARSLEPQNAANYYYLARIAEEKTNWAQATEHAEKAYRLSKDTQFLPLLAYYLTMQQRTKEAVTWLEKARKAEPQNSNVLLFLGMDYLELGKYKKAKEILKEGIAAHPDDTQLHFQLGIAHDRLQEFDKAVEQFELVLRVDPKNAAALNYLGYSFADRNVHLDVAEDLVKRAVAIDPDNGAYWDSFGWIHYRQGKYAAAIADLEKATQINPDPLIYEHLGEAYWADQKADRALVAWTKSLALNPKNKALKKKVQEASTRVVGGSQHNKLLKYIEGNFRQISDLRGLVQVDGKWKKSRVKTQGGVYYLRPDRVLVSIGNAATPIARVTVRGQHVQIEPEEMGTQWSHEGLEGLTWLPVFFSGKLLTTLSNPAVAVKNEHGHLHYSGSGEEAWLDAKTGLLERYRRANPEGGQDEMTIDEYELVEGLWLPIKMRIANKDRNWKADLNFSSWHINDSQTVSVFDSLQP